MMELAPASIISGVTSISGNGLSRLVCSSSFRYVKCIIPLKGRVEDLGYPSIFEKSATKFSVDQK